jgi:hypothetical protein
LGEQLRSSYFPSYAWIYQKVSGLELPSGNSRESDMRFSHHARGALQEIALDLHLLAKVRGGPVHIASDDLRQVMGSAYWHREGWMDRYIEFRWPLLTDDAVEWLLVHEQSRLNGTINQLNERFADYARLAQLAVLHGSRFADTARTFLRKAAACLIGYRFHKDYRLLEALETVEACHKSGLEETQRWLFDLAPMIATVTDFTDGDETGALAIELADTILTVRPDLFPVYYDYLLSNEAWDDAEGAMGQFIRRVDLSNPVNQAIAGTVVDQAALKALRDLGASGDAGAQVVFEAQTRFLGGIIFKERESSVGSNVEPREKPLPPSPADYPPGRFKEYLETLQGQGIDYRDEPMMAWFEHWRKAGRGADVLDALEDLIHPERLAIMVQRQSDWAFELCYALRGKSAAFPWLVRAHRARHGWSDFFTPKETRQRFKIIAREYSDRWLEFIQAVAEPLYTSGRFRQGPVIGLAKLVIFCLEVGQKEVACKVAEAIVRTTLDRKADLDLPLPSWVPEP